MCTQKLAEINRPGLCLDPMAKTPVPQIASHHGRVRSQSLDTYSKLGCPGAALTSVTLLAPGRADLRTVYPSYDNKLEKLSCGVTARVCPLWLTLLILYLSGPRANVRKRRRQEEKERHGTSGMKLESCRPLTGLGPVSAQLPPTAGWVMW